MNWKPRIEGEWEPLEKVYPDLVGEHNFYGPSDYEPLLRSYGYGIIVKVDDVGYSGDSYILYHGGYDRFNGNQVGILVFGWGSCSGCDALQACNSMDDIADLRRNLHGQIHWGTARHIAEYVSEKAREERNEYHYRDGNAKRFFDMVKVYCEGEENA